MDNKVTSSVVKGLVISLALVVLSLIVMLAKMDQNRGIGGILIALYFGAIIWSGISYAKQMNGNVTFGGVFTHAFKTAAAVTAIMVVYTLISIKFISPETMEAALEQARNEMDNSNISDEQKETALNFTQKFLVPMAIGGTLLVYLITGVIAALISGAAAKKNPQDPFANHG
jgi:hypothetical protein